jgi:hypothetical protein
MIEDNLARIDAAAKKIEAAAPPNKDALLALLRDLRKEMLRLDVSHLEHGASVAGFADAAAHEATRKTRAAPLRRLALDGLSQSVRGFESSHPKLFETIGELVRELTSLGI